MTIDVQLIPGYNSTVLPGNKHTYQGRKIVGADMFRVDMTAIVPAGDSAPRAELEQGLRPEHVRPPSEPYGLILMSSQLFDCMYLTTPALVESYREKHFQIPKGTIYGGWPDASGGAWEGLLPQTTWYPNAVGILDELDGVAGAKVTIYEYTVDKAQAYNSRAEAVGELVNMVGYHCDRCHTPSPYDLGERFENRGPNDRYFANFKARAHARGADGHCKVPDGKIEQVVSQVASEMHGRKIELPSRAASCAAEEGCAQVRAARAATVLLAAA